MLAGCEGRHPRPGRVPPRTDRIRTLLTLVPRATEWLLLVH